MRGRLQQYLLVAAVLSLATLAGCGAANNPNAGVNVAATSTQPAPAPSSSSPPTTAPTTTQPPPAPSSSPPTTAPTTAPVASPSTTPPSTEPVQDLIPGYIAKYCQAMSPALGAAVEYFCYFPALQFICPPDCAQPNYPPGVAAITYFQFSSQTALYNAYSEHVASFNVVENERSCTLNGQFIAYVSPCEGAYSFSSQGAVVVSGRILEADTPTADTMSWTVDQQLLMIAVTGAAGPTGDSFLPWWAATSANWITLP